LSQDLENDLECYDPMDPLAVAREVVAATALTVTDPETDLQALVEEATRTLEVLDGIPKARHDVLIERARQIAKWGDAHDDEHDDEALPAVASYLANPRVRPPNPPCGCREAMCEHIGWFEPYEIPAPDWARGLWHANDRRERLVIAAALILAEIERMDRATARGLPTTRKLRSRT
jgi:hypothetical protein